MDAHYRIYAIYIKEGEKFCKKKVRSFSLQNSWTWYILTVTENLYDGKGVCLLLQIKREKDGSIWHYWRHGGIWLMGMG